MCHTWKLKKVNILPFSGLIYPLMGRKIKIPASCVFSYSFEEHSCAMRTLYYQNCRRSSRKYEITYLPQKGVMGVKNEKSGFLRFLVWVRKAHSSNYNNLLLKLKEEFEKMFQVQNRLFTPKMGWTGRRNQNPASCVFLYPQGLREVNQNFKVAWLLFCWFSGLGIIKTSSDLFEFFRYLHF